MSNGSDNGLGVPGWSEMFEEVEIDTPAPGATKPMMSAADEGRKVAAAKLSTLLPRVTTPAGGGLPTLWGHPVTSLMWSALAAYGGYRIGRGDEGLLKWVLVGLGSFSPPLGLVAPLTGAALGRAMK